MHFFRFVLPLLLLLSLLTRSQCGNGDTSLLRVNEVTPSLPGLSPNQAEEHPVGSKPAHPVKENPPSSAVLPTPRAEFVHYEMTQGYRLPLPHTCVHNGDCYTLSLETSDTNALFYKWIIYGSGDHSLHVTMYYDSKSSPQVLQFVKNHKLPERVIWSPMDWIELRHSDHIKIVVDLCIQHHCWDDDVALALQRLTTTRPWTQAGLIWDQESDNIIDQDELTKGVRAAFASPLWGKIMEPLVGGVKKDIQEVLSDEATVSSLSSLVKQAMDDLGRRGHVLPEVQP